MKVTSVVLYSSNSSLSAEFSFRDPTSQNPYQIKSISGLDADEIVSRFSGRGSDGGYYNLTLPKRVMAINVALNPTGVETYSGLRDNLYRAISASRTGAVTLGFKEGAVTNGEISGFVTKFESNLFSETPEVTLTITCDYPMLKSPGATHINLSGLDPSLTTITDTHSTAPHGFVFTVLFMNIQPSFKIRNDLSQWAFEIVPVGGFFSGDILTFSSEYNDKKLFVTRGPSTIHLADAVVANSIWPIIFPGENIFVCSSGVEWESIVHHYTYWGV